MLIKGHRRRVGSFVFLSIIIVIVLYFRILYALSLYYIFILYTCNPPTPAVSYVLAMSKHGQVTTFFFCPILFAGERFKKLIDSGYRLQYIHIYNIYHVLINRVPYQKRKYTL